jgi:hypothetical protein
MGHADKILINISIAFIFIFSFISFIELLFELFIALFIELFSIKLFNIDKIPFSYNTSLNIILFWTTFLEQDINSDKNNITSF